MERSSALSKSTSQKYVCWRSCGQRMYPPDIHITTCAVPVPSCRCHRYCRITPMPSCPAIVVVHMAVPPCLCQCACARAIAPGPLWPLQCTHAIVPPRQRVTACAIASCSITSDTQAVNIASVTYPLMVQPCWCSYCLYLWLIMADCRVKYNTTSLQ